MILFFGTRPGKSQYFNLDGLDCPYCKQEHMLSVSITPNYFHLFWLPLFKVSSWQFVRCDHCKKTYHKQQYTAAMQKAVKKLTA